MGLALQTLLIRSPAQLLLCSIGGVCSHDWVSQQVALGVPFPLKHPGPQQGRWCIPGIEQMGSRGNVRGPREAVLHRHELSKSSRDDFWVTPWVTQRLRVALWPSLQQGWCRAQGWAAAPLPGAPIDSLGSCRNIPYGAFGTSPSPTAQETGEHSTDAHCAYPNLHWLQAAGGALHRPQATHSSLCMKERKKECHGQSGLDSRNVLISLRNGIWC